MRTTSRTLASDMEQRVLLFVFWNGSYANCIRRVKRRRQSIYIIICMITKPVINSVCVCVCVCVTYVSVCFSDAVTMTSLATYATSPTTSTIPTSPMNSVVTSIPTSTSQGTNTFASSICTYLPLVIQQFPDLVALCKVVQDQLSNFKTRINKLRYIMNDLN